MIGTVLGAAVFDAMRRLAHVDASAKLFGQNGAANPNGNPNGIPNSDIGMGMDMGMDSGSSAGRNGTD